MPCSDVIASLGIVMGETTSLQSGTGDVDNSSDCAPALATNAAADIGDVNVGDDSSGVEQEDDTAAYPPALDTPAVAATDIEDANVCNDSSGGGQEQNYTDASTDST